jgi:hypothetical protein
MTALAAERFRRTDTWKHRQFTLAAGTKAWKGGRAMFDTTSATSTKVIPAVSAKDALVAIGIFDETIDATAAAALVQVDLEREIAIEWWPNATSTDAVAATDLGKTAYAFDDQTVTITRAGRSPVGRIWAVDTVKNLVAIERSTGGTGDSLASMPAVASFTANDWAPASVVNGAIYDVPTTAAASTITLPAAASDGTLIYFAADGTKNGHTVQYRDGTGPVNLTTALTASKRHLVVAAKRGGLWFANAYVSP